MSVLTIDQLQLQIALTRGKTPILRSVNVTIEAGQTHALVGESGAGKTMVAKALLGILPKRVRDVQGRILFNGQDLLAMPARKHRALLGRSITLIPQDPMVALNPVHTIRKQFHAALRRFMNGTKAELDRFAIESMQQVSLKTPEQLLKLYPHELSGGMRQRVLIAMAFAPKPLLVIADEPTTALDVTVQKRVLSLLRKLQAENGTAVLFVTHDLGIVAKLCHSVSVMYQGRVVESGSCEQIINNPQHDYTKALLHATPHFSNPESILSPISAELSDSMASDTLTHDQLQQVKPTQSNRSAKLGKS